MTHKATVIYTYYNNFFEPPKKGFILIITKPKSVQILSPNGVVEHKATPYRTAEMITESVVKHSEIVTCQMMNRYTHQMGEYPAMEEKQVTNPTILKRVYKRYNFQP